MSYFEYPHTRTYDSDLGWLIRATLKIRTDLDNFIAFNTIKYADPIEWNITHQYQANTVVIDPETGNAYISTKPVPAGVLITDENYWTSIFNYGEDASRIRAGITGTETKNSYAPKNLAAGDWIWINGSLYETIAPIGEGNLFIFDGENKNVQALTVEDAYNNLSDSIYTYVFSTAVDMAAANIKDGSVCFTNGYYAVNDGGAGVYHVSTDAAGTYVELSNGLYANVFDNPLNIKKLGARGDGSEDIGTIVNMILDSGKEAYIPKGTYLVATPIILSEGRKVTGSGKALGGFWSGNHDSPVLIIRGDYGFISQTNGGFTLRDLFLVGEDRVNKTNNGITFRNSPAETITAHSLISNVNFFYLNYGVRLSMDDSAHETIADDLIIENCYFDFCNEGVHGHSYGIEITNSIFADCIGDSVHMISGSGMITSCKIFGCVTAINLDGGQNFFIAGTEIDGCTGAAVIMNCNNSTFEGSIYGDCKRGIDIYGKNNVIDSHFTIVQKPTTSPYGDNPECACYIRGDSAICNLINLQVIGNTGSGILGYIYNSTGVTFKVFRYDYKLPNTLILNGTDCSPQGQSITNCISQAGLTLSADGKTASGTFVTGHVSTEGYLPALSGNRLKYKSDAFTGGYTTRKLYVKTSTKYNTDNYMMVAMVQEGENASNAVIPATISGTNINLIPANLGGAYVVSEGIFSDNVKNVTMFLFGSQRTPAAVAMVLEDIDIQVFPV